MKRKEKNILNLTSMWTLVLQEFQAFQQKGLLCYGQLPSSDWPNRIWITDGADKFNTNELKEVIANTRMSLSLFEEPDLSIHEILKALKMDIRSVQTGMSKDLSMLTDEFPCEQNICLNRVSDTSSAREWSDLFFCAFGYRIPPDVVRRVQDRIRFFTIRHMHDAVGTVALYKTGDTLGIHSLGIKPQARGQGIARKVMHRVLNDAKAEGISLATLQASEMANRMYTTLGFQSDFIMINYKRT